MPVIPRAAVAALLCLALPGCAGNPNRFQEPVGTFRTATAAATEVARPYFVELNQVELHLMAVEASTDKTIAIDDSFVRPTFAPEGIRARLETFQLIDAYAQRLADIAGSDAAATLRTNAEALGTNLKTLTERIQGITGDETAANYAGPITSLVTAVQAMWIERKREAALRTALNQAAPQVNRILLLLEKDLAEAHRGRVDAGTVVAEIRDAHSAMVAAANAPRNPKTFGQFVTAVQVLSLQFEQARAIVKGFEDAE